MFKGPILDQIEASQQEFAKAKQKFDDIVAKEEAERMKFLQELEARYKHDRDIERVVQSPHKGTRLYFGCRAWLDVRSLCRMILKVARVSFCASL
jgi:hypothetical protein